MKKELKIENHELFYNNENLKSLAEKYGTPLKVTFLDLIKERIVSLKETFNQTINEKNYKGKFIYLNANKANYGYEEVETAYFYSDGLECSSYHDLLLTNLLMENNKLEKSIVCNGYKTIDYIDESLRLSEKGKKICIVIDNLNEYEYIKKVPLSRNLEIGIRVNLPCLYAEEHEAITNDRFGVTKDEFKIILDDLKNYPKLILTTIHFHQRGFDYDKDKFFFNIKKVFGEYYALASKKYDTVVNFDMGGGTPLPVHDDFDYKMWANLLIECLKELSLKYNVREPNIISENGKYTQKDSTINIYEIIGVKHTTTIPWYIVNGSLLIAMPEMYALGEEIFLSPVNKIDEKMIKTRLAGLTCDCDDVYFDKSKGYFMMPKKEENEKVYVALLGTGSYQNSMNGKGGIHHCMLPEEKDLVVYTKNDEVIYNVRNNLQSFDDMKKILNLK